MLDCVESCNIVAYFVEDFTWNIEKVLKEGIVKVSINLLIEIPTAKQALPT